jgi:hypothetical protein
MDSRSKHSILCLPIEPVAGENRHNMRSVVMAKQEKGLLRKDKEYVKFVQLLKRAEKDGRLDGGFTCKLCGMKFSAADEAATCCKVTVS